jgi:squalene-hopene/tetraprenyl-beta-curcumene cyclase
LALRNPDGYWRGYLSSSALSTATAVFALAVVDRKRHNPPIEKGLSWLKENQNEDGGWGDTINSPANLSTTLLCYCALGIVREEPLYSETIAKAESWLTAAAGSLEPEVLAKALDKKYGNDKTFSVPILTMCALAGRLGEGEIAWRLVKSLPFELAVLPHQLYKWLRLPVVSYALPALIAIGQAKYHHLKPRNPLIKLIRLTAIRRSLKILANLQPENGGFLEATPLTSFVVMSLAAAGNPKHPVVEKGVDFLVRSMRDDGSWPIDTDLATWVTTLSVNAVVAGDDIEGAFSSEERMKLLDWLLNSQHRVTHPYTHAAPGGWAWTDLPGAVPDADDTSGVLLALRNLDVSDKRVPDAVGRGFDWLLNIRNSDGGIPTFCRGWSKLPFDRSAPDITAHAVATMSLWYDFLPAGMQHRLDKAIAKGLDFLDSVQRVNGSWIPLWFGNQFAPGQENPSYGTARVLTYLLKMPARFHNRLSGMTKSGFRWLLAAQNKDGGWGGGKAVESSIEETALAVDALAELLLQRKYPCYEKIASGESAEEAVTRGVNWLVSHTDRGKLMSPSPIGLYFARLWYFERLYPVIFCISALNKVRKLKSGLAGD